MSARHTARALARTHLNTNRMPALRVSARSGLAARSTLSACSV